jgi:hypothetical protein
MAGAIVLFSGPVLVNVLVKTKEYLDSRSWNQHESRRKDRGEAQDGRRRSGSSKPTNAPPGTKPIDKTPWSKVHEQIKKAIGNGPRDWTGITPEGDVISTDPETGEAINHGPAEDFVP